MESMGIASLNTQHFYRAWEELEREFAGLQQIFMFRLDSNRQLDIDAVTIWAQSVLAFEEKFKQLKGASAAWLALQGFNGEEKGEKNVEKV